MMQQGDHAGAVKELQDTVKTFPTSARGQPADMPGCFGLLALADHLAIHSSPTVPSLLPLPAVADFASAATLPVTACARISPPPPPPYRHTHTASLPRPRIIACSAKADRRGLSKPHQGSRAAAGPVHRLDHSSPDLYTAGTVRRSNSGLQGGDQGQRCARTPLNNMDALLCVVSCSVAGETETATETQTATETETQADRETETETETETESWRHVYGFNSHQGCTWHSFAHLYGHFIADTNASEARTLRQEAEEKLELAEGGDIVSEAFSPKPKQQEKENLRCLHGLGAGLPPPPLPALCAVRGVCRGAKGSPCPGSMHGAADQMGLSADSAATGREALQRAAFSP